MQPLKIIDFRFANLLPGPTPTLVLALRTNTSDEDMGSCERNGEIRRSLVVCQELNCGQLELEQFRYVEYDEGYDDGDCEIPTPNAQYQGFSVSHSFSASFRCNRPVQGKAELFNSALGPI